MSLKTLIQSCYETFIKSHALPKSFDAFQTFTLGFLRYVAREYSAKNTRKVAFPRFVRAVVNELNPDGDEDQDKNFLNELDLMDLQSLRVELSYYLHDYPSKNATKTVSMEELLEFMVKNHITNNKELIQRGHLLEKLAKDDSSLKKLKRIAETFIFSEDDDSSVELEKKPRMSRKQLEAALAKCLNK
jgi:hypothetical protein